MPIGDILPKILNGTASINLGPINNILLDPLDTDTRWPTYQGLNMQHIKSNTKTPNTTSAHPNTKHTFNQLINNILLDPLAEITNARIVPDLQAHHSTPHHSEAQKHALLNGKKEMPWTPQRTLVNLMPIGDILPKISTGTASVNLGPISGVLLDSVAEITEVKIVPDHQAHSQISMHHWLLLWKQQERQHQRTIDPPTHSGSLISDGNSLTNYHMAG